MKINIFFVLCCLSLVSCAAQKHNKFSQEYKKGKELYDNAAYSESMSLFLSLSVEQADNKVYKDASLLYAMAAIRAGNYNEAMQMLKQIEIKYPEYYTDEVNYHQAVALFYLKEYDKALLKCRKVTSPRFKKDILNLKNNFIHQYKDTDKLGELFERNKEDKDVAFVLYQKLAAKAPKTPVEREKILTLKSKFGFEEIKDSSSFGDQGVRHIGILLPYITLGSNSNVNSLFYDFHSGLKLGFDSLNMAGEKIRVHYFGGEKDTNSLLSFLNSDDFENLDMVIGPVYSNLGTIAFEYNTLNKHTVVLNPFSNYIKNGSKNDQVFFNYPLAETIGSKTAEMSLSEFYIKNAVVLYGANPKDSSSAMAFKSVYEKGKGKVLSIKPLNKANIYNINKVITEKNKDSIGVVIAFASDPLSATNVLTAMEVVNCKAPLVAPKEWLDIYSLTLAKYQHHHTHFIFPNYYSSEWPRIKEFNRRYYKINNLYPSEYTYQGYDMALFFGQKLIAYGDKFSELVKKETGFSGALLQGYNFNNANNNQVVQFVKFEDNKLVPLIDFNK